MGNDGTQNQYFYESFMENAVGWKFDSDYYSLFRTSPTLNVLLNYSSADTFCCLGFLCLASVRCMLKCFILIGTEQKLFCDGTK